ncbi:MAG: tetratricopeptide repeat protein [Coriobacteriia bacterium]|nr:tetratricopeptide repeat protein [Coriobacteriia bacterium]
MTSQRLTTILRVAVATLAAAVIGVVAVFAYNIYLDRQAAIQSTPALRVVAAYEKIVRAQPNNAPNRVRLGEAYAAAGQYQKAIEQLNAAIKIDEKHPGAYLDLGLVAMINNEKTEAIKYFKQVVTLTDAAATRNTDAKRELALYNLGKMALDDKDYEQSVGYFKEALRIRRDASDTYLLLARAFDGLGDSASAIKNVEYSLAFDPNFSQANYQAGEYYLREKNYLKASEHIRKAIDVAPEAPEPQELLKKLGTAEAWVAKVNDQRGTDPAEALTSVKIARRIDPESAAIAVLHGQVLERLGKQEEALVTYKEALKLDTSNAKAKAAIKRLEAEKPKKTE